MDETVITDLKQFITVTISQQLSTVATKDDIIDTKADITRLEAKIDQFERNLSGKIDDVQVAIADAITSNNETVDARLANHERRLVKLEHRPT